MSRFNTGNPLDSDALQDLSDNAKNADLFSNDVVNESYKDRFGRNRKTIHGMESEFDRDQEHRKEQYDSSYEQWENDFNSAQDERKDKFDAAQKDRDDRFKEFLLSSGYQFAGDYAAGVELTEYNQIVRDENGEFWRVSGQVDLPYLTTGAGVPEDDALAPVGDAVLRQDLNGDVLSGNGGRLVGGAVIHVDSIAELRDLAISGMADGDQVYVKNDGLWVFDSASGKFQVSRQDVRSPYAKRSPVTGKSVYTNKSMQPRVFEQGPIRNGSRRRPMLIISYDDASDEIYTHAWPVHKEEGVPGIFYITSEYVEADAGKVTWEKLKEMHDFDGPGRIEIGNHGYNHLDRYPNLSDDEIIEQIELCNLELAKNGIYARHAAYPWNANDSRVREIASRYFDSARSGEASIENGWGVRVDGASPGMICYRGRINPFCLTSIPGDNATLEEMKTYIDAIYENNALGAVFFHRMSPDRPLLTPDHLRSIIQYAKQVGVDIVTPSEAIEAHGPDKYVNNDTGEMVVHYEPRPLHMVGPVSAPMYLLLCRETGGNFSWSGTVHLSGMLDDPLRTNAGKIDICMSRTSGRLSVSVDGKWTVGRGAGREAVFRLVTLDTGGERYVAVHLHHSHNPTRGVVVENTSRSGWEEAVIETASYLDVSNVQPYQSPLGSFIATLPGDDHHGVFEHGTYVFRADGTAEINFSHALEGLPAGGSVVLTGDHPIELTSIGNVTTGIMAFSTGESSQINVAKNARSIHGRTAGVSVYRAYTWVIANASDSVALGQFRAYMTIKGRWRI